MKTTDKKVKEFDTVKTFREIKEQIAKDIQGMNFEQFQAYLDKTRLNSNLKRSCLKSLRSTSNIIIGCLNF